MAGALEDARPGHLDQFRSALGACGAGGVGGGQFPSTGIMGAGGVGGGQFPSTGIMGAGGVGGGQFPSAGSAWKGARVGGGQFPSIGSGVGRNTASPAAAYVAAALPAELGSSRTNEFTTPDVKATSHTT
jgi:hypothetical protein